MLRRAIVAAVVTVAYTIEQCWHRVPGGTAVAALAVGRALDSPAVRLVGVAAHHSARPPEPFRPAFPVRQLPLPRPVLYEAWHRWRRPRVQRATGPVDLVHATTTVIPPRSAPLVVTVHDLAPLHEPEHFPARGRRFFLRGLALARAEADVVLCSSQATLADCAAAGFAPARLRLVPLGVDGVAATPAEVAAVRARHGLDRAPYLLFTGTLEPRKNLPALLAAFGRLPRPDHLLVLVGPAGWGPELGPQLERAGAAASRVRPLGFVPEADKRALLAGAAALCYPSRREGFGLPVLEAMAQGTPVVTSRGTATEEVAGEAAVLVDPSDVDDIAGGIEAALADGARLAARGRARAGTMTWARTAELTAAAYRDALTAAAR